MKMGLNAARPSGKDPGCVLRDSLDLCHTEGMFCSSYEGAISSSRRQVKKVPPSVRNGRWGLEIPHKLGGLVLNPGDAMAWIEHD